MKKLFSILFAVIFIVFGVITIVSGAHKLQTKDLYDASTTAQIVGIEREWTGTDEDGFDQYNYHVYVTYEVNGVQYEQKEYPGVISPPTRNRLPKRTSPATRSSSSLWAPC